MQTYQTLSLIGCIIGMLLMFLGMALGALVVGLSSTAPAGTTEGARNERKNSDSNIVTVVQSISFRMINM